MPRSESSASRSELKAVTEAVRRWEAVELEAQSSRQAAAPRRCVRREEWRRHPQGSAVAAEPCSSPWDGRCSPESDGAYAAGTARRHTGARPDARHRWSRGLALSRGATARRCCGIDPPSARRDDAACCPKRPSASAARRWTSARPPGRRELRASCFWRGRADAWLSPGSAWKRWAYSDERLRNLNPSLAIVCHDAYGWTGPWARRRGFDSLVQMSSGIAAPRKTTARRRRCRRRPWITARATCSPRRPAAR